MYRDLEEISGEAMRRHSKPAAFVSFCALALAGSDGCKAKNIAADAEAAKPVPTIEASEPVEVSMVELVATPAAFAHKRIRVVGFVSLEFEGNAIYLHREDWQRGLTRNGIWLDVTTYDGGHAIAGRKPGYAIVEGVFEPETHGHMGLFSGSIAQLSRLDPWPFDRGIDGGQ